MSALGQKRTLTTARAMSPSIRSFSSKSVSRDVTVRLEWPTVNYKDGLALQMECGPNWQSQTGRLMAIPELSSVQAGTAAARATGFSTIGILISAESAPNKIASHHTIS